MAFELTYIWHDCFIFQNEQICVIFDFWKDPCSEDADHPLFLSQIPPEKPIYVLVSHHHKDHFVKNIFNWQKERPNITYILSKDVARFVRYILRHDAIYTGYKPTESSVVVLRPEETWENGDLRVNAFGSTDIGNSYLLTLPDGMTIFHAGDLNAWVWIDESTPKEVEAAIRDFKQKLEPMQRVTQSVDVAMFPVDSRIGREWYTGASIFVRTFNVGRFFPMHFGLGENPAQEHRFTLDAMAFSKYANPAHGEYIGLATPYSRYLATP